MDGKKKKKDSEGKVKLYLCITKYHAIKTYMCLIKYHAMKTRGGVNV
jgi:hypothetical protein